jgi:hypothetical protein
MATTSTSAAVAVVEPVFTESERLALAGFLAGYTGLTREAYALDLRQFASWCQQHQVRLFQVRRADIECFARDLEARGRARRRTRVPVRPARRLIRRTADVRTNGGQLTAWRRGQGSCSQAGLDAVTRLVDSNG